MAEAQGNLSNKKIACELCAPTPPVASSGPLYPPGVVARFESHVDRSGGPDACHPWTGGANWHGYGLVNVDGPMVPAHRLALELALGRRLLRGEVTRHANTCTTRRCCNQRHLSPGSTRDNARDRVLAGRSGKGTAKRVIAEATALTVRRLYADGARAIDVASATGVSLHTVFSIIAGRSWGHLGPSLCRKTRGVNASKAVSK